MSGDVVLFTGAAQGLGEHIARALHGQGFRAACSDIDSARARARSIKAAMSTELDVCQKSQLRERARRAVRPIGIGRGFGE